MTITEFLKELDVVEEIDYDTYMKVLHKDYDLYIEDMAKQFIEENPNCKDYI